MARHKVKSWNNSRLPNGIRHINGWTVRIQWFAEGDDKNIRLKLEDYERP